jgi:phosphonate metabolism protein (transferase hexapeptide repeat family)
MTQELKLPVAKQLGETPWVHESSRIVESWLGPWTSIGPHSSIVESSVGDYTHTAGDNQIIYSDIGKFCSIAAGVRLNPGNHPMDRVTQHHMTYRRVQYAFAESDDEAFFDWRRDHKVTIGHDVWIGHGALVLPGVNVGTGAVIGAGAVVTHDVDPYTICAGVPARPIRQRIPQHVSAQLLRIAWWDWSREQLEERFDDLSDLEAFLEKYGG